MKRNVKITLTAFMTVLFVAFSCGWSGDCGAREQRVPGSQTQTDEIPGGYRRPGEL